MSETKWTAEAVKDLRQRLGLTQEEMANKLGVTVASITRWERGITKPTRLAERALCHLEAEHEMQ